VGKLFLRLSKSLKKSQSVRAALKTCTIWQSFSMIPPGKIERKLDESFVSMKRIFKIFSANVNETFRILEIFTAFSLQQLETVANVGRLLG
jgi:hypothetical protein